MDENSNLGNVLSDILFDRTGFYRLSRGVEESRKQIETQSHEIQQLQSEVAKLRLVVASVTDLLQESGVLGREQVISKMQDIDQRERMNIGNNSPETVECPDCQHRHLAGFSTCIYCGAALSGNDGTSSEPDSDSTV